LVVTASVLPLQKAHYIAVTPEVQAKVKQVDPAKSALSECTTPRVPIAAAVPQRALTERALVQSVKASQVVVSLAAQVPPT
jgi:hypothetical protein